MADNLISQVKKKPMKYLLQGTVGIALLNEAIDNTIRLENYVHKYEPQIRNIVGYAGYLTGQIGIPLVETAGILGLGYIAMKGTGMFMEKYYYKPSKVKLK
nr:hypothetical protein [Candidatus Woesearchaeota archaeon]